MHVLLSCSLALLSMPMPHRPGGAVHARARPELIAMAEPSPPSSLPPLPDDRRPRGTADSGAPSTSVAKRMARGALRLAALPLVVFDLVTAPLLLLIDARRLRWRQRNRPKRIILVRHGQSKGNVDRTLYARTPDSLIPITDEGFAQGRAAGAAISKLVGGESVHFFFSPYLRTRQTLLAILTAFEDRKSILTTSEPRLREQDFGNFQDARQMERVFRERQRFGRFYYRFPDGEAGTDVYDRMCDFWSTLFRFMDSPTRTVLRSRAPRSRRDLRPSGECILWHGPSAYVAPLLSSGASASRTSCS